MDETRHPAPQHVHPPDWTEADTVLEELIEDEEKGIHTNRILIVSLFGLLALVIAALVLSIIGVNRDIEAVAKAVPKDDSVGAAAIVAGAVTADKLAAGAVGTAAIADGAVTAPKLAKGAVTSASLAAGAVGNAAIGNGAVGRDKLANGSVNGAKVANDSLTGDDIKESTLAKVPAAAKADTAAKASSATTADSATKAGNASKLGGVAAAAFLSGVRFVQAESADDLKPQKGPLTATCPSGSRVIGGGAAVLGVDHGVALVRNAPDGETRWVGKAEAFRDPGGPWRLVVTAICAAGG